MKFVRIVALLTFPCFGALAQSAGRGDRVEIQAQVEKVSKDGAICDERKIRNLVTKAKSEKNREIYLEAYKDANLTPGKTVKVIAVRDGEHTFLNQKGVKVTLDQYKVAQLTVEW